MTTKCPDCDHPMPPIGICVYCHANNTSPLGAFEFVNGACPWCGGLSPGLPNTSPRCFQAHRPDCELAAILHYASPPMNTTTCAECGITYGIGQSPWCKDQHRGGANYVESVTWPGGKVFENLGHEPVRCDSPADLKREMKARNLEPMVRHIDGSPHTRSWATMDPYTLEQGRILAERQATSKVRHANDDGPSAETVRIAREAFAAGA